MAKLLGECSIRASVWNPLGVRLIVKHVTDCSVWVSSLQPMLPGPAQTLQRIMGSGTVRLMAVAGLSLAAVWGLKASSGSTDDTLALQQILEV